MLQMNYDILYFRELQAGSNSYYSMTGKNISNLQTKQKNPEGDFFDS